MRSTNPVDTHIGARIRMRRMQLGLSQQDLADPLQITFQQIQKYEKGTNRVGGSRMAEIAAVLEVDVGFFYFNAPGATKPNPNAGFSTMDEFMASKDGLIIARAFVQIADPNVRHIIAQSISKIGRALAPYPLTQIAAE